MTKFEEWLDFAFPYETVEKMKSDKKSYIDFNDLQSAYNAGYSAGEKSEREKYRLIPVTERLPNENDGEVHKNCGWGERHCDFIKVLASLEGEKYLSTELFNLTDEKFEVNDNTVIAWKPLPEA